MKSEANAHGPVLQLAKIHVKNIYRVDACSFISSGSSAKRKAGYPLIGGTSAGEDRIALLTGIPTAPCTTPYGDFFLAVQASACSLQSLQS